MSAAAVATTCAYCGVGCGVLARPQRAGDRRRVVIAGDPLHPANRGRLCAKGAALGETLGEEGRLLTPLVDGREAGWDEALARVAGDLQRILERHGPEAVAFYVSGQLLTEDYYVANKLMKGFIGSANIDTNSRLCMASAVTAHVRAYGEDVAPGSYEDLELADLVVLVGSNLAWCHPVLHQRLAAARERRPEMRIVVIDPRSTATCEVADLHLAVAPGTDAWLFAGLLLHLEDQGATDAAFVAAHTAGLDAALAAARRSAADLGTVASTCRIEESRLIEFYRLFERSERTVTAFSMGVNQSSAGTDKATSIINCHLLTGRIGKPGSTPLSLTGQPNAMGGREVGGLATTLAAHLDVASPAHRALVREFWRSPRIASRPGLKALELFEAIGAGRIKAVWIMGTNPAVSLPDAQRVRQALRGCELVVVSDVMRDTDTARLAHVLLPAAAWGEKDGTVTNSERCISRQRAFLPPPGEARPDWRIVCDVAARLGWGESFDYSSAHEIFAEHAGLSARAGRAFDIGALASLTGADYDALAPRQWPLPEHGVPRRPFADGVFAHADGRARFVACEARPPVHARSEEYPFVLNTGRVRDHWHTMTRTGLSARLSAHVAEPFIDLHPQDALLHGLRAGELARVASAWGAMVGRVQHSGGVARGEIFVPMHWNASWASDAGVGAAVNPARCPLSGQPELKHTPVRVEPFAVRWYGFLLLAAGAEPPPLERLAYWVRVTGERFTRYEIAGREPIGELPALARAWLGGNGEELLELEDLAEGSYRAAHVRADGLRGCLVVGPRPELPAREGFTALFARPRLLKEDRHCALLGAPAVRDEGALVCSCFAVRRNPIERAVREHGARTAADVTARLRAGGNCGSCLPEIRRLVQDVLYERSAESLAEGLRERLQEPRLLGDEIDTDIAAAQ